MSSNLIDNFRQKVEQKVESTIEKFLQEQLITSLQATLPVILSTELNTMDHLELQKLCYDDKLQNEFIVKFIARQLLDGVNSLEKPQAVSKHSDGNLSTQQKLNYKLDEIDAEIPSIVRDKAMKITKNAIQTNTAFMQSLKDCFKKFNNN